MAHAAHRQLVVKAGAALSLAVVQEGFEGGGREVAGLPWIADVPVPALARLLLAAGLPDVEPRISAKRQAQLEAAARLDHYAGQRGAWAAVAVQVIADWADGQGCWLSSAPRSLGALAIELRREANYRRHRSIEHRRTRLRPLMANRRRMEIKRWRAERRRLQADYGEAGGWALSKPGVPRGR